MGQLDRTTTALKRLAATDVNSVVKREAVAQIIAPHNVFELIMIRRQLAAEMGLPAWTPATSPPSERSALDSPRGASSDAKPAHLTERARAPRGRWWIP